MKEYWKVEDPVFSGIVFKGNVSLKNSLVNPAYSGTNESLSQFPKNHYSIIPVFQYSNWGEAPKPMSRNFYPAMAG
jgi:hypothetical protein